MTTETGLIGSISIEALLAANEGAVEAMEQCREILEAAAARLKPFGISLPQVAVQFPGNYYRDLRDMRYDKRIRNEIERQVWRRLYEVTNIETLMDAKTRTSLHKMLDQSDPYGMRDDEEPLLPALTRENVEATFRDVHARRGMFFEDAVHAVYRGLLWDYKTNTPGLIGETMIVGYAVSEFSREREHASSLNHNEHLQDLERVLCVLDGQEAPTYTHGLRSMRDIPWGRWTTVPSATRPLIEVKVFKKGTAHVRILNREHVQAMNGIISKRYPHAVGTGDRHRGRGPRRKSA